jgi:putative ABC transport system permease protein
MSAPLVRRELRGRPGRLALVASTVVLGVAFCVGAFGFSQQVEALISPPTTGVDVALPAGTVVLSANTSSITSSTALDARLLATVRAIPGVAQADANYDQPLSFVVPSGTQSERPPVLRGVVLSSTDDGAQWKVVAGRFPSGPQEVAVDAAGAAVGDTALGQRASLQLPIGTDRVRVVGLVEPRRASTTAPATDRTGAAVVALSSAHVILDRSWAPRLLDAQGRADRITVIPLPGVNPDGLATRVRRAVPDGISVLAATSRAAQTQHTIAAIDSDVRTATLGYAALTMLVAALVIVNSYSVLVAQRTRELGLLRLVGASRGQVIRMVLGESTIVGLVGAVAGGALGAVLAYLAARVVRTGGIAVGFKFTGGMVVVAFVVGVTTSIGGSLWPAIRAGRVAPLEALSDTRGGADRESRGLAPLVLAAGGLGTAAWIATRSGPLDAARVTAIGVAILAAFIGLALLSRWIVVPFARVVGWPVVKLVGVTARLGIGNTARQPSRTAGAASTLMVGLALVSTVGTFGASANSAIQAQVGSAGHADLYVERRGVVRVSTTTVTGDLNYLRRGISEHVEITDVDGELVGPHGDTTAVVASELGRAARIIDLGVVTGDPATGPGGETSSTDPADRTILSTEAARQLGVRVGDHVTLRSISGETRRLTVVATYANTAIMGPAVVPWTTARAISADGTFELAAIEVRPGAPLRRVEDVVRRFMHDLPKVGTDTPVEFAALSTSVTDTTLRIILVLLGGALGIGLLGLATTLALSTLERRRELVMLRAVGASRAQVRSLIRLEASMIGVIAATLGVGIGALVGRIGAGLAPSTLGGAPVVPWLDLGLVAVVAIATAWAVSLGVARRASRVPPAEAGRI